jgi:hypothetical protein
MHVTLQWRRRSHLDRAVYVLGADGGLGEVGAPVA